MASRLLFFIFFLFLFDLAFAEVKTHGERHQEWVKQVGEQYWRQMTSKLQLLDDNYNPDPHSNSFIYRSPHGSCSNPFQYGTLRQAFKISFVVVDRPDEHTVTITYTDCKEKVAFEEVFRVKGKVAKKLTPKDIKSGEREFRLQEGESLREHSIINANGVDISRLRSERIHNGIHTTLTFAGENILTLTHKGNTSNTYITKDVNASVQYRDESGHFHTENSAGTIRITTQSGRTKFFGKAESDQRLFEITPAYVDTLVAQWALKIIDESIKKWIAVFIKFLFPVSEATATAGGGNSRLVKELDDILLLVISGQQPNEVIQYLDDLKQDAQKGLIKDNRPEE